MASCKLTMIGMYNYDNTLFDGLTLPVGINKQTAVNEILMRCGEFEVNYPDIDFMKLFIKHWGEKHYRTFEKWVYALSLEFEPLYNYDRFEEYEDTHNRSESRGHENDTTSSRNEKTNANANKNETSNSTSQTDTKNTNDVVLTHQVSAYDSADYQNRDKETTDGDSSTIGNGASRTEANTNDASQTEANTLEGINEKGTENTTGNEVVKHTAHLFGNIGTTKSTEMLMDYIEAERFNIYEQIADIFCDEACIMVYV